MTDMNQLKEDDIDIGRRAAMQKIAVGVGALAGISVLPESWTVPVIGRIVLPAHAQTSGSVCAVAAGPLHINAGDGMDITWNGGAGPQTINTTFTAGSNTFLMTEGVFAESQAAALAALGVSDFGLGGSYPTDRDPDLCGFWAHVTAT